MPEQLTPRQELAVEQLASDERLTASLTDALATPLLNWAGRRAADLAGRMDLDDEQLAERLRDLRRAIRQVAGQAGPLLEAGQYIAQVEQLIGVGRARPVRHVRRVRNVRRVQRSRYRRHFSGEA
jgi:uncharacterized membrane protein YccC